MCFVCVCVAAEKVTSHIVFRCWLIDVAYEFVCFCVFGLVMIRFDVEMCRAAFAGKIGAATAETTADQS